MDKKCFIKLGPEQSSEQVPELMQNTSPGVNVIKLFTAVNYEFLL
jgi:hypothetical protein